MRFGAACEGFQQASHISMRSNELAFVATDKNIVSIDKTPAPKETIGTLQPYVVNMEFGNGQVSYYFGSKFIRSVPVPENAGSVCWQFQSEDNNNNDAKGYRGIAIMWIATKP
jgi:hypothetical protein